MATIVHRIRIRAAVEHVFAFHTDPHNLCRSMPPGAKARVVRCPPALRVGRTVEMEFQVGPWTIPWTSQVIEYEANRLMRDRMVEGPFHQWDHLLEFAAHPWGTYLTETLQYQVFATGLLEVALDPLLHVGLDTAIVQSLAIRRDLLEHTASADYAD